MKSLMFIPFVMLFYREIRRFFKVLVQTIVSPIISSSLYLLIFGVSLGKSIQLENGLSYLAFLIPGLVMMGCLNNSFQNASSSIVSSKFSGDLEDYRAAPLSNQQIIWAIAFGGLFRGLVVGVITFIVGEVFFWQTQGELLTIAHPLHLLVFLVFGGLSFAMLGMSVAFWARTFDQMSAVSSFILLPLIYLGGVFFSIDSLHPFWQKLSLFNPLLYLINGVRFGILGVSDVDMGVALTVALLGTVIFYLIAIVSLKRGSFNRW